LASFYGYGEVVKLLVALPGLDYNHKSNEVSERDDDVFDVNHLFMCLKILCVTHSQLCRVCNQGDTALILASAYGHI
jgi:hypothetical protein